MIRFIACAALAAASCSYKFDDTPPELPLVGSEPDMSAFPRLNNAPVVAEHYVLGYDDKWWWMMEETPRTLHSIRLPDQSKSESFAVPDDQEDLIFLTAIVLVPRTQDPDKPITMTFRAVGAAAPDATFSLPAGPATIGTANWDSIFYYWPMRAGITEFIVAHRNGSYTRHIPIPDGVDPTQPIPPQFNGSGSLLITRDANDNLIAHSTISENDTPIGKRPPGIAFDGDDRTLITVGMDGVRRVPTNGQPETVLDARAASGSGWLFFNDEVWYLLGEQLWAVKRDGSGQPHLIKDGGFSRVISWAPDGTIVYSTVPDNTYIWGASDAWLGNWNFMQRGFFAGFSTDGKRVRWIEHAALSSETGDLLTAAIPTDLMNPAPTTPTRLARNVQEVDDLGDGRLIATDDRAVLGTWNRIIAIDEQAKAAQWVATDAAGYHFIPGSQTDLLVDMVSGAIVDDGFNGFDVRRVPIPAKLPPAQTP